MALLAYEEPEKSPMFHLLSLDYRQHVADSLNRAILGAFLLRFLLLLNLMLVPRTLFYFFVSFAYSRKIIYSFIVFPNVIT